MPTKEHIIKIMIDVGKGTIPNVMLNFANPSFIYVEPETAIINGIQLTKPDYETAIKYFEENNIVTIMFFETKTYSSEIT